MAFVNEGWWQMYPLCKLEVTHTICSDHDPIIMELVDASLSRKQFRFRFENTWLNEPTFHQEVTYYWRNLPTSHLMPKLLSVSSFLAKWGRNFFHIFRDKVKKQKKIIDNLVNKTDEASIQLYFEERSKLDDLLRHEELYWKQRAKSFWLTE